MCVLLLSQSVLLDLYFVQSMHSERAAVLYTIYNDPKLELIQLSQDSWEWEKEKCERGRYAPSNPNLPEVERERQEVGEMWINLLWSKWIHVFDSMSHGINSFSESVWNGLFPMLRPEILLGYGARVVASSSHPLCGWLNVAEGLTGEQCGASFLLVRLNTYCPIVHLSPSFFHHLLGALYCEWGSSASCGGRKV